MATETRDLGDMPIRYVIPTSLGDVFEWAHVVKNKHCADHFRKLLLVHTMVGPNGPSSSDEITLHLQGFVQNLNITPYGTWMRR